MTAFLYPEATIYVISYVSKFKKRSRNGVDQKINRTSISGVLNLEYFLQLVMNIGKNDHMGVYRDAFPMLYLMRNRVTTG